MLRTTDGQACRFGNYLVGGTRSDTGYLSGNQLRAQKFHNAMAYGDKVSRPQGFNNQNALAMPLVTNWNIGCRMVGLGSFTATSFTTETLECFMQGEGTMVANASHAITMYCTMSGEGTLTIAGKNLENMQCTMDAGVRPSAFDIAQEVWQAQATAYNSPGTMGNKVNAAGGAADPWGLPLPGAYASGTAGYIIGVNIDTKISDIKVNTDLIPGAL